ncbi:type II secretion system F family protein [Salinactinospora qingdaonensis]|uniref:Type II secretion system protein GspF domain-containing protein n=1 Tax=Salinactinospora qingdaonensis TaxID=702744 RepID=A0ABP7FNR4_9ACTN
MIPSVMAIGGGMLAGAGVWLVALTVTGPAGPPLRLRRLALHRHHVLRAGAATLGGVLAWLATGWPVAGVLAAAGLAWLPQVLGPDRGHERRVARIEAVASWSEQIRDLTAGASGLQHAITATAPIAPAPIQPEVARLTEELRTARPPQEALADFATVVDVPTADLVAAALSSAAGRHAADLGTLLSSLAETTREQAAMLVRIAASRARIRTAMRIIVAVTIGLAALLLLVNPSYLDPYDGPVGQTVLAGIGALWAAALAWLARLARTDVGPRVLSATHHEQKGVPQ